MRGWYNIHDHDNLRMGFVPFTGSSKSVPETATSTPTGSLPDVELKGVGYLIFGIPANTFFLLVGILVLIVVALVCCCFYCFFAIL